MNLQPLESETMAQVGVVTSPKKRPNSPPVAHAQGETNQVTTRQVHTTTTDIMLTNKSKARRYKNSPQVPAKGAVTIEGMLWPRIVLDGTLPLQQQHKRSRKHEKALPIKRRGGQEQQRHRQRFNTFSYSPFASTESTRALITSPSHCQVRQIIQDSIRVVDHASVEYDCLFNNNKSCNNKKFQDSLSSVSSTASSTTSSTASSFGNEMTITGCMWPRIVQKDGRLQSMRKQQHHNYHHSKTSLITTPSLSVK